MTRNAASIILLACVLFLPACQCIWQSDANTLESTDALVINHGYALLYATLNDESGVDRILIIKSATPEVAQLLKEIALFSSVTKKRLEGFAGEDPAIVLDSQGLPRMEINTRDAISDATSKQIVASSGRDFEFRILLTQHDALNYITHLAQTLSKHDTLDSRKQYLAQIAKASNALHEKVIAQLKTPYMGQPK